MRVTERGEEERENDSRNDQRENIYFTERETEGRDGRSFQKYFCAVLRTIFNPCIFQMSSIFRSSCKIAFRRFSNLSFYNKNKDWEEGIMGNRG